MSVGISAKVYEIFQKELEKHLAHAQQELGAGQATPSQEAITQLGIEFHTIKGGAGFLGLPKVATTAGRIEKILRTGVSELEENISEVRGLLRELDDLVSQMQSPSK